ncbi:reverse transcriptase domain-containing protein [Mesorhizobium sp.]|uniref:reverse transcriptase domain-containing protein n=1 Tax=Mesorhizobium sp. TaxID=1871066 RepID=UPI0025C0DAA9|nr:reverse transcriptase domain-containing protein [Mesorhizobium sp.]
MAEVLNAIYEADFCDCSFGFRPKHSPHDALRAVHTAIMTERVNWIVEADIRNLFGQVDHAWLVRCSNYASPIVASTGSFALWLRAGVLEDGVHTEMVEGTLQGAGISPLLANVYLHYVLDLWAQQWHGDIRLVA